MPFSSWVDPGRLDVVADQIVVARVLVLQSPPKVTDGPVLKSTHWHLALRGSWGSISQTTSRHSAHGLFLGQVITRVAFVTSWVEKFECGVLPFAARCAQDLKPTAQPVLTKQSQMTMLGSRGSSRVATMSWSSSRLCQRATSAALPRMLSTPGGCAADLARQSGPAAEAYVAAALRDVTRDTELARMRSAFAKTPTGLDPVSVAAESVSDGS